MTDENKNLNTDNLYTEQEEALKSFLGSDTEDTPVEDISSTEELADKNIKKPRKKLPKNILWIIIGTAVVLIIVGIILLLNLLPGDDAQADLDPGTKMTLTVDESGEHQAAPLLNKDGELDNNSYGNLLNYVPADITQIDLENESGKLSIKCKTATNGEGSESTDSTTYTLVGFEDITLLSGGPDAIASDVSAIDFSSIVDIDGKNASDYGFDNPRAIAKITYSDNTTATITVGNDAPTSIGTYVMFGDNKTIYLVATDAVDGLFYSVLDLIDLNINEAVTNEDNSEFESVTLSGSAYPSDIEIRPNEDSAIDSTYVMISPQKMYISETEGSAISGSIRGLYASSAVCVNPTDAQLEKYGLKNPYAKLTAIYPDTTITLRASKPKDDLLYIMADKNIIYQIAAESVSWVSTSIDKLYPDVVINPNFNSLSNITVKDSSGTYSFDVKTVTEAVTNTEGESENVENTTAFYNKEKLDHDNFHVFYQNLCNMQSLSKADSVSGSPAITIDISYSTGRATDTIKIYATNSTKYTAVLNDSICCTIYKSYCTKFTDSVQDLINGDTVNSF